MFQKVLVANRGEIAVRAFRAAYELGLGTVAVFTVEDRKADHRVKARESYLIGTEGHPVRAYLDIDEIIRAAKACGLLNAPEKLKAAIDRLHRIEMSFDREIPADALARLPGVVSADRTGDKWQITTENPDTVIRLLVQFSREQGAAIVTLNTLAPSLDDAFLRLTREALP